MAQGLPSEAYAEGPWKPSTEIGPCEKCRCCLAGGMLICRWEYCFVLCSLWVGLPKSPSRMTLHPNPAGNLTKEKAGKHAVIHCLSGRSVCGGVLLAKVGKERPEKGRKEGSAQALPRLLPTLRTQETLGSALPGFLGCCLESLRLPAPTAPCG